MLKLSTYTIPSYIFKFNSICAIYTYTFSITYFSFYSINKDNKFITEPKFLKIEYKTLYELFLYLYKN